MTAVLVPKPQRDLDAELAAALRRMLASSSTPRYVRDTARAWLAKHEEDRR